MNATALMWVLLAWAFALGASIGSFVNLVFSRVPNGMSIVRPPSQCPNCGHQIRWFDNVPILAWLWLRARCRDCGVHIPAKYILAELGFGLFGVAVANAIFLHGHFEIVLAELSAAVVVTLLALLPPTLAGLRRQKIDDSEVRLIAHVEGQRLHHEDDGSVHAHGHLGNR